MCCAKRYKVHKSYTHTSRECKFSGKAALPSAALGGRGRRKAAADADAGGTATPLGRMNVAANLSQVPFLCRYNERRRNSILELARFGGSRTSAWDFYPNFKDDFPTLLVTYRSFSSADCRRRPRKLDAS